MIMLMLVNVPARRSLVRLISLVSWLDVQMIEAFSVCVCVSVRVPNEAEIG